MPVIAVSSDILLPQHTLSDPAITTGNRFMNYLFLEFTTAPAFSPADALPLTAKPKLLLRLEATFSLVTVALVASRVVGISQ